MSFDPLAPMDRLALRRQALTWLRADLAAWRQALPRSPQLVASALKHWQSDPDLAQWFTEHCASYEAIRQTLRQTPVPIGLCEAICQAQALCRSTAWWSRR